MNTGAKVAAAVGAGYLLGRTKKLKVALAVGMLVAGRKLPRSPLEYAGQGLQALQNNDQFAELSQQVSGKLADTGKAAAAKSAEQLLGKVSDRLRDGLPPSESEDGDESARDDEDAGDTDTTNESSEDDSEEDETEPEGESEPEGEDDAPAAKAPVNRDASRNGSSGGHSRRTTSGRSTAKSRKEA